MSSTVGLLTPDLVPPRYGEAALSDVLPSLLSALGLVGERDALGLEPAVAACVLLVDGLGWDLLRKHRAEAPFLNGLVERAESRRLTAGFPTTTTTSLTSLGTGVPAGEHGMTGYQMLNPDTGRLLNALQWDLAAGPDPQVWQPRTTALQRADAAGMAATMIAPAEFAGTGLTLAALRGGTYVGLTDPRAYPAAAAAALRVSGVERAMAYVYEGRLDRTGHTTGCESAEWRVVLSEVDSLAAELAEALPAGTVLLITADHGMVDIDRSELVEVMDEPALQVGVRTLAGEGRCRYVHVAPGAARDVLTIWRDELGDDFCVLSRAEAIEVGLLGPVVTEEAAARVGDVVVLARGRGAVFDRRIDSRRVTQLVGQHGSLTSAEVYVPLLVHRNR